MEAAKLLKHANEVEPPQTSDGEVFLFSPDMMSP